MEKLLNEIIEYIEKSEVTMESLDYAKGKSLNKLIEDGDMPDLYFKVKAAHEIFVRINAETEEEKFRDEFNKQLTEIQIPWLKYLDKE